MQEPKELCASDSVTIAVLIGMSSARYVAWASNIVQCLMKGRLVR